MHKLRKEAAQTGGALREATTDLKMCMEPDNQYFDQKKANKSRSTDHAEPSCGSGGGDRPVRRRARPAPPRADGGRERPSRVLGALPPLLSRAAAPAAPCPAMELWQVPLSFSRLRMFPFFDLAHYVASVLALKEQRGERGETGRGGRLTPPSQPRCYPVFPSPGRVRMGPRGEPPSPLPCGRASEIVCRLH